MKYAIVSHDYVAHSIRYVPGAYNAATCLSTLGTYIVQSGLSMNLASTIEIYAQRKLHYRMMYQGLPISIENRKGSIREGKDPKWGKWSVKMTYPYGYVRGSKGMDGQATDVFVGPDVAAKFAYVITTRKSPDFKQADEQKVMLGFDSAKAAKKAFLENYSDDRFFGKMISVPMEDFKQKVFKEREIKAGGAGSGCRGSNCGRRRSVNTWNELRDEHDRIKHHPFRSEEYRPRRLYKMQQPALLNLLGQVEYFYGKSKETKIIRNSLATAEREYMKGNLENATDEQEMALSDLHGYIDSLRELDALGEPGVYEGGYGSLGEGSLPFHPPSLKKAKRVPTDDPNETDNEFFDVTKRESKATKKMRDERTRRVSPTAQLPGGPTAVQHHTGFLHPLVD